MDLDSLQRMQEHKDLYHPVPSCALASVNVYKLNIMHFAMNEATHAMVIMELSPTVVEWQTVARPLVYYNKKKFAVPDIFEVDGY